MITIVIIKMKPVTLKTALSTKHYQAKHIFNITLMTSTKLVTNIHNEINE